ncbi:plant intracellular Ras-group-related LRR protein 1-like [Typha latifolia]|uniref:plant intracellular Ras-group-related LRR protein 1-like n=1 Tax=Typha latifolia TaxID=4733 RepID=UPI003C2FEF83
MRMEGKRSSLATREELEKEKEMAQKLDLSAQSLDSLPNPPTNLATITKLDISNNNLESIPESVIARLLNLVVLDAHSNQLKSLPNSIGCLSKLKVLNVSGNLLESLPKNIEDCKALEELNANFNKLTKLPDTMGFELTNLRKLSVNSNKLACLPYSTSHMTSLQVLDARLNCLRSLPDDLENLIRLEVLNISQNFQFLQSLPYAIGLLVSLVELDISYNKISVLPDSMGCLTKLRKFHAEGNPLVCPPMDVVEQSVEAVRDYLSARMNGTAPSLTSKKNSWFGKLAKCGTFTSGMISSNVGIKDGHEGLLMSDYRSINGLASPRNLSMFSPRRLFSPKRNSPRK